MLITYPFLRVKKEEAHGYSGQQEGKRRIELHGDQVRKDAFKNCDIGIPTEYYGKRDDNNQAACDLRKELEV